MKKSLLVFSTMTAIACPLACHADAIQDAQDSDNRGMNAFQAQTTDFTGSEYAPSDFLDLHLGKSEFEVMKDAAKRRFMLGETERLDRTEPDAVDHQGEYAEPDFDMADLEPIQNRLLDWVPDKVDRLQNGGFTTAPDNGSPVPYRLNGHVGIERGYPWDPAN
jgi:hypothetical protein